MLGRAPIHGLWQEMVDFRGVIMSFQCAKMENILPRTQDPWFCLMRCSFIPQVLSERISLAGQHSSGPESPALASKLIIIVVIYILII